MKQTKPTVFILLLIGLISFGNLHAQSSLIVKLTNGAEQNYQLTSLKKITFDSGEMLLTKNDATDNTVSLSSVDKMMFKTQSSDIGNVTGDNKQTLSLYPNPVYDALYVSGDISERTTVFVYALSGIRVIQTQMTSSGEPIDVSGLTPGFYVLKVNGQTAKFRKL